MPQEGEAGREVQLRQEGDDGSASASEGKGDGSPCCVAMLLCFEADGDGPPGRLADLGVRCTWKGVTVAGVVRYHYDQKTSFGLSIDASFHQASYPGSYGWRR